MDCLQEECTVDPSRSVDVLITIPGCPSIAVEVDGAHHCIAYLGPHGPLNFSATNSWPDGSTQLRDWMLQKLGYRVANVMFYDVSPKALKHAADQAQQPHNSVVQTVARIVRAGMKVDAQQKGSSSDDASAVTHKSRTRASRGDPADSEASLQAASQGGSQA